MYKYLEETGTSVPIETINRFALDPGQINGQFQRSNDAVIAIGQRIFDVMTGRVDQNAGIVPGGRFEPGVLLNGAQHFQTTVGDRQHVLAQQRNQGHVTRPHHVATFR